MHRASANLTNPTKCRVQIINTIQTHCTYGHCSSSGRAGEEDGGGAGLGHRGLHERTAEERALSLHRGVPPHGNAEARYRIHAYALDLERENA